MKIFILMFMVAYSNGDVLKLKFLEKGQYYNQTMILEENSIEFDVPEHAGINQTQYFYDYHVRMIAVKSANNKNCYVYDMPIDEPSSDDIKAGVLQFDGKFPINQYMVAEDNILPHRYLRNKNVTPKILQFCGGLTIIECVVFNSTKEAEQALKDQLSHEIKISSSRARRSIRSFYDRRLFDERLSFPDKVDEVVHSPVNVRPMIKFDDVWGRLMKASIDLLPSKIESIEKIVTCNWIKSGDEVKLCNGELEHLDTICEIKDKNCRFKLACHEDSGKFICKKGEHVYTDILCCDFKCKKR